MYGLNEEESLSGFAASMLVIVDQSRADNAKVRGEGGAPAPILPPICVVTYTTLFQILVGTYLNCLIASVLYTIHSQYTLPGSLKVVSILNIGIAIG